MHTQHTCMHSNAYMYYIHTFICTMHTYIHTTPQVIHTHIHTCIHTTSNQLSKCAMRLFGIRRVYADDAPRERRDSLFNHVHMVTVKGMPQPVNVLCVLYVCMCVCIYVDHIHVAAVKAYVLTSLHTYTNTYTSIHIQIHTLSCIYKYIHSRAYTNTYTLVHVQIHTLSCAAENSMVSRVLRFPLLLTSVTFLCNGSGAPFLTFVLKLCP